MASAARLPLKPIAFSTALVISLGASRVNLRKLIRSTITGPGSYSRIAATLILLANLKNVPFVWHVCSQVPLGSKPTTHSIRQLRVFNAILKHCLFSKPSIPTSLAPSTLFLPVITKSHSPLWECDYNLHKSNSTYFSDLDITRSHLICALLQPGIEKLHHNVREKLVLDKEGHAVTGAWGIMLGGVSCSFKREIGIYEGFEMWSRLLSWDRKWVYCITHFVKKDAVKPSAYIIEDGSWFGGKGYRTVKGHYSKGADVDEKAIFASAISKYVVKLGRLTVHPEVLLGASGILPPRPGGWHSMTGGSGDSTPSDGEVEVVETNDVQSSAGGDAEWDWKRIEAEKEKGMKYVEHFAALDGLHHEFSGSSGPALGKFRDFLV